MVYLWLSYEEGCLKQGIRSEKLGIRERRKNGNFMGLGIDFGKKILYLCSKL